MKLLLLKTKEVQDFPEEYGKRLYEQGKAVFPVKTAEPEAEPKQEAKAKGKKG